LLLFEFADQSVDMDSAATTSRGAVGLLPQVAMQLFFLKGVAVIVLMASTALLFDK